MTQHRLEIKYEEFESLDELPEDEKALVALAWEARKNAYAPYSHFNVGVAVQTQDGKRFKGNNQENANFRASCAETVALNSMHAKDRKNKLKTLAVVGGPKSMDPNIKPEEPEEPVAPCGQCRQDLKEAEDLAGEPIVIIMASRNRIRRVVGIENLLPFAFGPANLGVHC